MAEGQTEVAAQATQDDSGVLSMEQALAALDDENWDGVKDAQAAPAPQAAVPDAAPAPEPEAKAAEPAPGKKVLAPDGELTIPYERLQRAEAEQQRLQAEAEAARQQLAQMALQQQLLLQQQAAAAPANQAGNQPAPLAVPAGLFGNFSDEDIAAGTQKLAQIMEQRVAEQVAAQVSAQVSERVAQEIAPVLSKSEQLARNEHERAIFAAHPNADSIAQSAEFAAWIDAQPTAVARALRQTLDPEHGGTAQEVIEVLDAWKAATSANKAATAAAAAAMQTPNPDPRLAAEAAIARAQAAVPASISNIPGGHPGGQGPYAHLDSLDGAALSAAVEDMTPEQIDKWLASSI